MIKTLTAKTAVSFLAIAWLLGAAVTPARSEIRYTDNRLTIKGDTAVKEYGIQVSQMNGISLANNHLRIEEMLPAGTSGQGQESLNSNLTGSGDLADTKGYVDCSLAMDLTGNYPAIWGNGNRINFYNPARKAYNSIYVAGVYNLSDGRFKEDVSDLTEALGSLLQLRPVTFRWRNQQDAGGTEEDAAASAPQVDGGLQYGFIAQEIEEVLPDVVTTAEGGVKAINYTSLIPLLVRSVQELQGQVAAQASVIDNLNARLAAYTNSETEQDRLTCCTPNPTNGAVTIGYALMPETTRAMVIVTNLVGTTVASVECDVSETSVDRNITGAAPGVYLATLVCDGNVRDSRQIALSR